MAEETTVHKEYRGISVRLATEYLETLGGERVTDGEGASRHAHEEDPYLPAEVAGDGWHATLDTEMVQVGGSLEFHEVRIEFAGDGAVLDPLLEKFGQKAMRAGG